MYKKRTFLLFGLILLLLFFSACDNNVEFDTANMVPLIDNLDHEKKITELMKYPYSDEIYRNIFPKTEKISRDSLVTYTFPDEKSVKNISNEELSSIAYQNYLTSDFFEPGEFSFFDFSDYPLLSYGDKPFGDEYEKLYFDEDVFTYLIKDKVNCLDIYNPYPTEETKEYIEKELEYTLRPYGDEMDSKTDNESYYIAGENEHFIDYEVRYTVEKTVQVHRRVYFKNLVQTHSDEENWDCFYYLGNAQSTEEVETVFDLYLNGLNSDFTKVIYRNTEKNSKQVLYKAYYIESQFDETDGKWYGRLFKENFVVDTKTHEIRQYEEMIKQTEIE